MEDLVIYFNNGVMWFCIAIGVAMVLALIMGKLEVNLITKDGSLREFTIIDLEFPSNTMDIPNILNGIKQLPDQASIDKVTHSLRRILYVDFLFMPAIYGAVFILCMIIASKFSIGSIGQGIFAGLAWLQAIAWLCDVLENRMLLGYVRTNLPKALRKREHQLYVRIVWAKWILVLIGAVMSIMMSLYFWMKGAITPVSLIWIGVFVLEIVAFVVIGGKVTKKPKVS
jgi:hypothetical protein